MTVEDLYKIIYKDLAREVELEQESTQDHWQDLRERAAIAAMQGLLSDGRQVNVSHVIKYSIICADELIKKLKGE